MRKVLAWIRSWFLSKEQRDCVLCGESFKEDESVFTLNLTDSGKAVGRMEVCEKCAAFLHAARIAT